ncbi:EpsG family protein [Sphingomonas sp. RHCKR7]|uniref:EpsG family protein n=1 Tax=Sphingomonas folli TaxID=2862497 RepID=UPI001C6765D9|nr:EpsG family protein [Sphingomonas folli]MBW6526749.1 EpsG family protein [Sphingomonas folli]
MREVLRQIWVEGQAYLFLYVMFAAAMVLESAYESERFSRALGRICIATLILFIGLRWETGTDWLAYLRIFLTPSSSGEYDAVVFGIDQGYLYLNQVVFRLTSDYTYFLLLDAFVALVAVYYFIERSTRLPAMGVYLFYTSYAITHFMGSNRRMLAIGLACIGFLHMLRPRRLWQGWPHWMLPFAGAAAFHRTSLMAIPALLVPRRAWPAGWVIGGLLTCVVLGVSGVPFAALEALGNALSQFAHITVVDKLLFYTSGGDSQSVATFDVMGQALLGVAKRSTILVIFIAFMRWHTPDEYAQRLYNIYVIGCGIYFLLIGSPVFQVTSTYYTIVEVVLLPIILSQVPQYKVPYIMYLLIVPFFLLISALSPYMELYVPYRSIFTTY